MPYANVLFVLVIKTAGAEGWCGALNGNGTKHRRRDGISGARASAFNGRIVKRSSLRADQ